MTAVTSLDDDVFVVRSPSDQVEVYHAETFTWLRFIKVPGLRSPQGLAACAGYRCLYVSDTDDSVYRAELSDGNAVTKWSVAHDPSGLSVNRKHNLLVACCSGKMQEYNTHGTLVRDINLRIGILQTNACPWHAIQLSSGHYVVSHYAPSGEVNIFGVDGREQDSSRRFVTMHCPRSLAVAKNDHILVADTNNDRILSMNSDLHFAKVLALPVDDGIQLPWGLCLDESRGRLYVGEGGERNRVLVFDSVRM